jgi:hypothetical protein
MLSYTVHAIMEMKTVLSGCGTVSQAKIRHRLYHCATTPGRRAQLPHLMTRCMTHARCQQTARARTPATIVNCKGLGSGLFYYALPAMMCVRVATANIHWQRIVCNNHQCGTATELTSKQW